MGKHAETEVLSGAAESAGENPELRLAAVPKRRLILDGMLEAVGTEGYERTSVRTVLDRTGLYRQAFYDNFADKDDCYLKAFEAGIERVEGAMAAAAGGEQSWQGKLQAALAALLGLIEDDPDYARGLIVEVHAAGPEALARRSAAMQRAAGFLDIARTELDTATGPPPIAPEGIAAGIHAVIHGRLAAGASDGFRELLPEFMYFAVMPYFGAAAASEAMEKARASL